MIASVRSMGMHEALVWVYMQTILSCALIYIHVPLHLDQLRAKTNVHSI